MRKIVTNTDEALDTIASLIDDASSQSDIRAAQDALDALSKGELSPEHSILVHYFQANLWATKLQLKARHNVWAWEQPEIQSQILELRSAVAHSGFKELEDIRKCQILTNLGNQLNTVGRFIEAIDCWDRALSINPNFAMASGNRGLGFSYYAHSNHDRGHEGLLLVTAHDAYRRALTRDALYDNPASYQLRDQFAAKAEEIKAYANVDEIRESIDLDGFSLGETDIEQHYRSWCLKERLFINPLNDLGNVKIAAADVMTLPSIVVSATSPEMPRIFGFFNQMKQEFVSARYLYYEGMMALDDFGEPHFSDKDNVLYNTLDYPAYSLNFEKLRMSYRAAYSIFDKIAFFLNSYLALKQDINRVSFRNIWYTTKNQTRELRPQFNEKQNWPLRGLFWLSKDFYDRGFKTATAPSARELSEIRNHLEHKYLQIHDTALLGFWDEKEIDAHNLPVFDVSDTEFNAKCLELLKVARNALVYLSLAVHQEEQTKRRPIDGEVLGSMPLSTWDDDWKR